MHMEKLFESIGKVMQDYPVVAFAIVAVVLFVVLIITALLVFIVLKSDDEISVGPIIFKRKSSLKLKKEESNLNIKKPEKLISNSGGRGAAISVLKDKLIRLQRLNNSEKVNYVLIGGTYIDLILLPISTQELRPEEEWSDLESPKIAIGGSAMCVGRYLWADYGIRSHLLTPVGLRDDAFSIEFRRLLENEIATWLIPDGLVKITDGATPLTVIFKQLDKAFTTMFTYRGALSSFGWLDISDACKKLLSEKGVLYISGFTKTNLSVGLAENLSNVSQDSLVVLDHGRINLRTDNPSTLRSLSDAFSSGCIDVSICSLKEIIDFFHAVTGKSREYNIEKAREILEDIAKTEVLPSITIIRTNIGDQSVVAYSIVNGVVDTIPDHSRRFFDGTPVAPLNAFNATLLHGFISEQFDPATEMRDFVISLCQKALSACHKARQNDPSKV